MRSCTSSSLEADKKDSDVGTVETADDIDDLLPMKDFAQHQEKNLGQENEPEEMETSQKKEGLVEEESIDSDTADEQSVNEELKELEVVVPATRRGTRERNVSQFYGI